MYYISSMYVQYINQEFLCHITVWLAAKASSGCLPCLAPCRALASHGVTPLRNNTTSSRYIHNHLLCT